jgi:hypothetical protein
MLNETDSKAVVRVQTNTALYFKKSR